ncbi:exonuclease, DNA polymerase III, epsilon subunit family [Gleimia coleocanis DSM 15436]|uniref:Exonuclease, DNA polymerase III, epsilon subunit family n=1 Tax=Gleimia coleocanis DSM 15436 TaxID=525245 RepID=C0W1U9_9ACTO|nr:exonuclease domain-containing protein [Gleimia coleocanis]EEH63465.1 exonuclease, DNA polymerase III, epsilon subunit family [Gleimia coleocanis DSM 15436]
MSADLLTDPQFLENLTLVSVDIETTGLGDSDAITELAAVKYQKGQVVETFSSLVNPGRQIPVFITRLTGIDNQLVADAPTLREVLPVFLEFCDFPRSVLLAHNARFDTRFLMNACAQLGLEWQFPASIDTVFFSRALLPRPQVQNHRLGTLAHHFGIKNPNAHRALADAYTCLELYKCLLDVLHAADGVELPEAVFRTLTEADIND